MIPQTYSAGIELAPPKTPRCQLLRCDFLNNIYICSLSNIHMSYESFNQVRYIVLLNPNFCIKVNQLRKFSTVKDISLRTLQVGEISSTTLQRLGIRYTEKNSHCGWWWFVWRVKEWNKDIQSDVYPFTKHPVFFGNVDHDLEGLAPQPSLWRVEFSNPVGSLW